MKLSALIEHIPDAQRQGEDAEITGLAYDSRQVTPGALFVALRGAKSDGHDFIAQALNKGAAALMIHADRAGWYGAHGLPTRRRPQHARRPAAAGRDVLRPAVPAAGPDRRHRHERQDDHGVHDREHLSDAGREDRPDRHHRRDYQRQERPAGAHHAGSARLAAPVRRHGPGRASGAASWRSRRRASSWGGPPSARSIPASSPI